MRSWEIIGLAQTKGELTLNSTLYKAWLQYAPIEDRELAAAYSRQLGTIVVDQQQSRVANAAVQELKHACQSMLGIVPNITSEALNSSHLEVRIHVGAAAAAEGAAEGITEAMDRGGLIHSWIRRASRWYIQAKGSRRSLS